MKIIVTIVGFILVISNIQAQTFTEMDVNFMDMGRSDVSWGDFDNDNDLDILISGIAGYDGTDEFMTILYRNDNGEFVDINAGLPGLANCHNEWGDYDGDGDLDIIMIGGNPGHILYLFENIDGEFTELSTNLPAYGKDGVVRWDDYDRDGDLDLLLGAYYTTDIFRNDGSGIFTALQAGLPSLNSCMGDWGDYDNDGDSDIIICGNDGAGGYCDVYRNEDGVFVPLGLDLPGLFAGVASWVDVDMSGSLDLFITGYDETLTPLTKMYLNDLGYFYDVYAGVTSMALGAASFGDMDNDGDQDLFMSGNVAGCGNLGGIVYKNDNGTYITTNVPVTGIVRSDADWGDYDNDGDLDLVVSGFTGSSVPYTRLFRNDAGSNQYSYNAPPERGIEGYSSVFDGDEVVLSWDPFSDDHTPSHVLSYNVYVGTAEGLGDVVSPNADIFTGYGFAPGQGNAGASNEFVLKGLSPGTYYWAVQAIDQSAKSSLFSEEQMFTITGTGTTDFNVGDIVVYPNPTTGIITIESYAGVMHEVSILSSEGRIIRTFKSDDIPQSIDLSSNHSGLYVIRWVDEEGMENQKRIMKF